MSSIKGFFEQKNIFLTGATGFLGSCLIEKLLRCCDVKHIYVLMRPKKDMDIQRRIEQLAQNSVFDTLKEQGKEDALKKIIAVAGDVSQENLGLSAEDREMLRNNVQIAFHSAATLDFEADLISTVNINLLGTRRVVQLCNEMKNLEALVHVSSAYVNAMEYEANEKLYPAPMDINDLLRLMKESSEETIINSTPKIIGKHANPYTFTKHFAEHEVANSGLPATIVRPSMITGAWKEPVAGWTISKNGPQGFLMGAGKGVVRRLPVAKDLIYDYIPVDVVVNTLMSAAFAVVRDGNNKLKIYHCTSSTCNPFRWQSVCDKIDIYLHTYPLLSAVWYPSLKFLPSLLLFRISAIFVHMIPAYILDTVTRLAGGRPVLVKLHTNINKSLTKLEKFIFTEWKFYNPNLTELHNSLTKQDQEMFGLDITSLQWTDYFVHLTYGVRTFLNKEPPKNLEKARKKDRILMVAHRVLQGSLYALIWWLTKTILASTWTNTMFIIPLVYVIFNQL